jgi:hypothetical protein
MGTTNEEAVAKVIGDLVNIGTAYVCMHKDLRALVAEMDDLGTQPWKSMLQDIIDKYTDQPESDIVTSTMSLNKGQRDIPVTPEEDQAWEERKWADPEAWKVQGPLKDE